MDEFTAFVITGSLLSLGFGGLWLRDYFKPAQVREEWFRQLAPVIRFLFWSFSILIVLIVGYAYFFAGCVLPARPRNPTASRMNQLAKAMFMYSDDNGGRFPAGRLTPTESLWLLYPKYASDPKLFLNPNENLRPPDAAPLANDAQKSRISAEWIEATGFVYLEGVGSDDSAEMILFERVANRGGRNVLIGAGTVEFQNEKDFQKLWKARPSKNTTNAAPAAATPASLNP
jgi:hypothetical protein